MSAHEARAPGERIGLPALLVGFVLDYIRWLALVPMVFAWAFLLLAVVLILAVNFQGNIDRMIERAEPWVERWLGPAEAVEANGEAETITLTEEDFKPWVYRIWLVVALGGYLLGLVRGWLFGPGRPPPLKRKLSRAALFAAACSALLCFAWLFGTEAWAGSAAGWLAMFIFGPFVVWLISAASLATGHAIGELRLTLMRLVGRLGSQAGNRRHAA